MGRHCLIALLAVPAFMGCADLTAPHPSAMPEDVEAFVVASGLPDVRSYREPVRDDVRDVLVFTVEWGSPQDCPSGCFFFSATGIRHQGTLGWLEVQGAEAAADQDRLVHYDFGAGDDALYSDHLLGALRDGDLFNQHLYSVYRLRLTAELDVPETVIARLASRLVVEGWPWLATSMLQRAGPPRCETSVLEELATLGGGAWSWGATPGQAGQALEACT